MKNALEITLAAAFAAGCGTPARMPESRPARPEAVEQSSSSEVADIGTMTDSQIYRCITKRADDETIFISIKACKDESRTYGDCFKRESQKIVNAHPEIPECQQAQKSAKEKGNFMASINSEGGLQREENIGICMNAASARPEEICSSQLTELTQCLRQEMLRQGVACVQ